MGKTVLEGRGHVRSGYVTAYHAVLMHWSCSNLPVPKEVQPSHRITTFGFHRLRMNVIRFHSSLYLQQRSKRSQELHMEKQQQTIKSFLLLALIFFFLSYRIEDAGVRRLHVARGLFRVSRLWEAHRYRGLHPRQKQLLLRALLRGKVCSSVQPLQKGAKIILSLKLSFGKYQNTPKYITTESKITFFSLFLTI